MKNIIFSLVVLANMTSIVFANWTAPEHPDPWQILREANKNTRNGDYQTALEKYLWFYNDVLKYNESYYGVRLSYALYDWYQLGKKYPPALKAMKAARERAEENVKEGTNYFRNFHDFVSINEIVNEEKKSVELFMWLDANYPEYAKHVYELAQPALLHYKKYQLCDKYVEPEKFYDIYANGFKTNMRIAKKEGFDYDTEKRIAYRFFTNKVSTLVALLVLNNKSDKAKEIATRALKVLDTEKFRSMLSLALKGKVPEP